MNVRPFVGELNYFRDAVRGSKIMCVIKIIRECKKFQYWSKTVEHGLLHHLTVRDIALPASPNEPSACIVELRTVLSVSYKTTRLRYDHMGAS
jgi:hypothetical protein